MNKKRKIAILFTPAYGHINPILPVVRELVKRGHIVSFYGTDEFKKIIEATGSKFILYKKTKFKYVDSNIMTNAFKLVDFMIDASEIILKINPFSKKDKPDIIIHDSLTLWGKIIAHKYSIPAVSVSVGMLPNPKILLYYTRPDLKILFKSLLHTYFARKRYMKLLKEAGISYKGFNDIFINEEKCNLVFTTKFFQLYSDTFKNISFVGPSLVPTKIDKEIATFLKNKKHVVYVSLGTITNNDVNFFRICIDVFKNTKYNVIISLGKQISLTSLPSIPGNIFVRQYWPQLKILENSELFITHGGMNSIMESAYYGVPMIVVPQRMEQRICALRLQELGAGIFIDKKKFTKERLDKAINKIKTDPSFARQIKRLQNSIIKAGGYKKAVDEILLHTN